ncbi:SRPBCC family protein [Actinoplanes derwentensis]|uniref:Polyketide cyclase / dehydrase and lipid transport n=1 Tax=Actinoplanes derwentensis TaxID=113562 RepID=A0A1H1W313_9ACTN|nr:SRPBCC family protein [Actinoplanes derwentensis]GID84033.1 polyketide cyclase [Actinoplanes derwentensis]SDS91445.1 Polyketide cyclase / dehydrase and lipid transport [Actinoplanes derwentensis]
MATATSSHRHLAAQIDRPAKDVYDYVSDPANLPEWAPGLGSTIELVGGEWMMDSTLGRITVTFAPRNEFGILDHHVRLESGETFYNPVRVIPDGDGCEVVFTVRRAPATSDEDFERDVRAVSSDLAGLKRLLESQG